MSEYQIVENCAPTLAGLKTANLFTTEYENKEKEEAEIRKLGETLAEYGLGAKALRYSKKRVLVYLYRRSDLKSDIEDPKKRGLLRQYGYPVENPEACIDFLRKRIAKEPSFPHEVGLFLGYPAADVQGFLEYGAGNALYTGYWKVYSNVEKCRRLFEKYDHCKEVYIRQYKNGRPIGKLAITR